MRAQPRPSFVTTVLPRYIINRDFALWWLGGTISNVGDFVFDTTVVIWVVTQLARGATWAPLAVSGVLLAVSLPTLLVRPFAGALADRWDKRRLMQWMDATRFALMLALLLVSALPLPTFARLVALYLVVLLASACAQFFAPAQLALLSAIVPDADLPRASGLQQITTYIAIIGGPSLAGLLFFVAGAPTALGVNAASFALSWLAVRAIRPHGACDTPTSGDAPRQHENILAEMAAGLRLVAGNPALRMVALSLSTVMLGLGTQLALNIFFVTTTLHASASLYGMLSGAFGIGSVIGAGVASKVISRVGLARTYAGAMTLVGVGVVAYSLMTSFPLALLLYGLVGIPNAINVVAYMPLVLRATPPSFVARVNSIITPAYSAAMLFSETLAGYLAGGPLRTFDARLFGLRLDAMSLMIGIGGLVAITAGIYALAQGEVMPSAGRGLAPTERLEQAQAATRLAGARPEQRDAEVAQDERAEGIERLEDDGARPAAPPADERAEQPTPEQRADEEAREERGDPCRGRAAGDHAAPHPRPEREADRVGEAKDDPGGEVPPRARRGRLHASAQRVVRSEPGQPQQKESARQRERHLDGPEARGERNPRQGESGPECVTDE